jgi:hypothetical protein
MALNGVYRFLYFYLIKKIPIKDVPSGLEDHVFDLEGVELGKYALQLPPPSNNKIAPDSSDWKKRRSRLDSGISYDGTHAQELDLSAIELQPLIARFEAMNSENSDTILKMNSRIDKIESKFDGIDSRFDGMDSRFDVMDSQLMGIRENIAGLMEVLKSIKTDSSN